MAKRRAVDSEDEAEDSETPVSKRPKTEGGGDEQLPGGHRSTRRTRGNEHDEAEHGAGDNDQAFDEKHTPEVLALLAKKGPGTGSVAEHGIIESIEMHHFMCHKFLAFNLGPQINFIIGHNGSGKSAVLSALTVALGGKATSTGRGTGLKSFVREGQTTAEVTVSIKNRGDEAFKPEEYGDSISITRRFTKDGSSTWKIRSKNGRVISTKKEELAAICDHMDIQVDNPLNILTQGMMSVDAARQFLSATNPSDKYKFFLKGTQLSQLSGEYDICLENILSANRILKMKQEAIPDLRSAYEDASRRFSEANKALETKRRLENIKKELAWAHVKSKEKQLEEQLVVVEKAKRVVPKVQASLDEATARFNATTELIEGLEEEIDNLPSVDHLKADKTTHMARMRAIRDDLATFKNDQRQMSDNLKKFNNQIKECDANIAEEEARLAADTQAKREETARITEEAKDRVTDIENQLKQNGCDKQEADELHKSLQHQKVEADAKTQRLRSDVTRCEMNLEMAKQQERDAFVPYGNDIRGVRDQIQRLQWRGNTPLGPLGYYVAAKDPQTWGRVLRQQMGSMLFAFVVTNSQDREQLKKILAQSRNTHINIIIAQKDLFDYSRGEPPSDVPTVLRALNISDEWVARILINNLRIERMVLQRTRADAQSLLRRLGGQNQAWTLDEFIVTVYKEGGGQSRPMEFRKNRGNSNLDLLLTGRTGANEIREWQESKANAENALTDHLRYVDGLKRQYMQTRRRMETISNDEQRLRRELNAARSRYQEVLDSANEDVADDIGRLKVLKNTFETQKKDLMDQFEDVERQRVARGAEAPAVQQLIDQVVAQLKQHDERRDALKVQIGDASVERLKLENDKRHWVQKVAEAERRVHEVQETADVLQEEFTNWTAKAQEYCERVPVNSSVEKLKKSMDSIAAALQQQERRNGASVEEISKEVNKTKQQLETAEHDLRQMLQLNKHLKNSLKLRLTRWQEFRRHIALRCKLTFQDYLSRRGYFGKVNTDDQLMTQGDIGEKDPRSLSGGEKSFSTICLLLSLWDAIGCPLRCLDEFDVFMDAVNRRISMNMMVRPPFLAPISTRKLNPPSFQIEFATTSDKRQYILITPQDMQGVRFAPSVRVHKMHDPERGQTTLNFAS
ncbi:P-loop containing nucleoside triphosphate hydrolase protein [Fistulina hepatica ATCC 64428]|uniref:p-loop containing nucleoside triphosphate hydrolase protein n=1 Tax=Fistulina hepatica ATCC 64428 TaxID=1128425 RepID=A0A0D7A318_9AGAR|nr:P-loop containing nucleoside triphosphate hydrolase protein [Fistulina hepatica ATCC 64428]